MKLISSSNAAAILGVDQQTVTQWASCKIIPHYRINKHFRFDEDEIIAWLQTKRVPVENIAFDAGLSTPEAEK
jgi:excisionase family DNA binding protein